MIAIFPRLAECAALCDTEKLACMVRQYFGGEGAYSPKLDIKSIFKDVGIPVEKAAIDAFCGLVGQDEGGRFYLCAFINPQKKMSAAEEMFALANLLGHYFFQIQPLILRGEWKNNGIKEKISPQHRYAFGVKSLKSGPEVDPKDRLADQFAISLLAPAAMVRRAAPKFDSLESMAKFFGLHIQVLTRRLIELECPIPGTGSHMSTGIGVSDPLIKTRSAQQGPAKDPARPTTKEQSQALKCASNREKQSVELERIRNIARRIDSSV